MFAENLLEMTVFNRDVGEIWRVSFFVIGYEQASENGGLKTGVVAKIRPGIYSKLFLNPGPTSWLGHHEGRVETSSSEEPVWPSKKLVLG